MDTWMDEVTKMCDTFKVIEETLPIIEAMGGTEENIKDDATATMAAAIAKALA